MDTENPTAKGATVNVPNNVFPLFGPEMQHLTTLHGAYAELDDLEPLAARSRRLGWRQAAAECRLDAARLRAKLSPRRTVERGEDDPRTVVSQAIARLRDIAGEHDDDPLAQIIRHGDEREARWAQHTQGDDPLEVTRRACAELRRLLSGNPGCETVGPASPSPRRPHLRAVE